MSTRTFPIVFLLAALTVLASCTKVAENPDHAACRRAWVKTFNVIFDNAISNTDVRWVQACMAKKGYKRIYDTGRCSKLEASIREPQCYEKA